MLNVIVVSFVMCSFTVSNKTNPFKINFMKPIRTYHEQSTVLKAISKSGLTCDIYKGFCFQHDYIIVRETKQRIILMNY